MRRKTELYETASDKLNAVFELHKSKGIDIKAITEKKFFALFQNNSDKKDAIQYSSITDIDSFVGCIGEYTGQFSIEGKGVCLIDLPWRYIDTTKKDTDDYKLLTTKIGAVFQPKPNSKTSVIVIRGDLRGTSEKLDAVFELCRSKKIEVKAITEKKFWMLFEDNNPFR